MRFKSILIFIFIFVASAGAEIAEFCDAIELQDADWSGIFSLPKFDPDLGTLKTVEISLNVSLSQQVAIENTGRGTLSLNSTTDSVLTVLLPDDGALAANTTLAISQDLGQYDGDVDYAGSSGMNLTKTSISGALAYPIQDISAFELRRPGENLTLEGAIETMQNSSTKGSASSLIRTKAEASVCVYYGYEAGASSGGSNK